MNEKSVIQETRAINTSNLTHACPGSITVAAQKLDKSITERGGGSLQLQDKPATPTTLSVDSSVCQTRCQSTPSGILTSCNMIDPSL